MKVFHAMVNLSHPRSPGIPGVGAEVVVTAINITIYENSTVSSTKIHLVVLGSLVLPYVVCFEKKFTSRTVQSDPSAGLSVTSEDKMFILSSETNVTCCCWTDFTENTWCSTRFIRCQQNSVNSAESDSILKRHLKVLFVICGLHALW